MSGKQEIYLCEYCNFAIYSYGKVIDCKYHAYHNDLKPCEEVKQAFEANGYSDSIYRFMI